MAWTIEHIAQYTPGDAGIGLGFLTDGTCCVAYRAGGDIHEALRAVGATTWTDTVILSNATIVANDPGGMQLGSWAYDVRGSKRALAYWAKHANAPNATYPDATTTYPPRLWQGVNSGGGWSFAALHSYTEAVYWRYWVPDPAHWYISDANGIFPRGLGVAVTAAGAVGVFVAVADASIGADVTPFGNAIELWVDGSLTTVENLADGSAYGVKDSIVADSASNLHLLWHGYDDDAIYTLKYSENGGGVTELYSDASVGCYTAGLALDAADNVFAFYSIDGGSGFCLPIGGAAEATGYFETVSGAVKGTGLNAAGNAYLGSLIYMARTSAGTWRTETVGNQKPYLNDMAATTSKLCIAFTDANGAWLATQGGRAPFWMIF